MKRKYKSYLAPLAIIFAGLLIAVSIFLVNRPGHGQSKKLTVDQSPPRAVEPTGSSSPALTEIKKAIPITGDDPALGNSLAKVTLIEFSDFQCPFCGFYALDIFPEIEKNYIATGQVRTVFKSFPLPHHDAAALAAEAAACANDQSRFWEYQKMAFENQQKLDQDSLKQYARNLGLDQAKFDVCLDSRKYRDKVNRDITEGLAAGLEERVPTFVINGTILVGAESFSKFQAVIDQKLKP